MIFLLKWITLCPPQLMEMRQNDQFGHFPNLKGLKFHIRIGDG